MIYLHKKIKKLLTIFEFYKSTLPINLAISILPLIFGGIDTFISVFLTIGFFSSIFFKELNSKHEYLFYYNNTISKIQLWLISYIFNFILLVIIVFSISLIRLLF